jgi:inosine-uridine nucleoside N-ribohydrolase
MEKSYEEILRLLERLRVPPAGLVFPGSTSYLTGRPAPERSPAALDLVEKALASPIDDPLYVLAIGAITNVASAILIEPEIIRHIVVVWLGGNPISAPKPEEYNLMQDPRASQLMFDSGLPLVHIPCLGVASHLLTTQCELEQAIHGRNAISDFLYDRFVSYTSDHFAWAKEIWDISTVAFMLNPDWLPSQLEPSPILTNDLKYRPAPAGRHVIRSPWYLYRNPIFKDLFTKLQAVKDD